jgi:hypothetical protein
MECKCGNLFELTEKLENNGMSRKRIENIAEYNGFGACRFGKEYKLANATYALISLGAGVAAYSVFESIAKRNGLEADVPRHIFAGVTGLVSTSLVYVKGYLQGTLCKQNSQFYKFLKEEYSHVLKRNAK